MKNLIPFLLLAVSLSAPAQKIRVAYSRGAAWVVSPGPTINGVGTSTELLRDTVNGIAIGRAWESEIYGNITTGVTLAPTITVTLTVGSTSLAIASSGTLGIGVTSVPFKLHVVLNMIATASEYCYVELINSNTGLILGGSVVPKMAFMTEDFSTQKIITLTAQLAATTGLSTCVFKTDLIRREPY